MSKIQPLITSDNHREPHDPEDVADTDIDGTDDLGFDTTDTTDTVDTTDIDDDSDAYDLVRRLADSATSPSAAGGQPIGVLLAAVARRAEAEGLLDVAWTVTDSPVGPLTLAATPTGLVRIGFGDEDDMLEELSHKVSPRVLEAPARLDDVRRQLDEYFAGRRHEFDVPLDWTLSHGFRRTVLHTLVERVPYGQTLSYKELATRSGNPKASRAVGSAMATNPIPLVVPCHRILRTGGALGGYGGGLDAKVWLLRLEGNALLA
jgi:methylated-DNA-[protein]-cysteine S-methyltransferase